MNATADAPDAPLDPPAPPGGVAGLAPVHNLLDDLALKLRWSLLLNALLAPAAAPNTPKSSEPIIGSVFRTRSSPSERRSATPSRSQSARSFVTMSYPPSERSTRGSAAPAGAA